MVMKLSGKLLAVVSIVMNFSDKGLDVVSTFMKLSGLLLLALS